MHFEVHQRLKLSERLGSVTQSFFQLVGEELAPAKCVTPDPKATAVSGKVPIDFSGPQLRTLHEKGKKSQYVSSRPSVEVFKMWLFGFGHTTSIQMNWNQAAENPTPHT